MQLLSDFGGLSKSSIINNGSSVETTTNSNGTCSSCTAGEGDEWFSLVFFNLLGNFPWWVHGLKINMNECQNEIKSSA